MGVLIGSFLVLMLLGLPVALAMVAASKASRCWPCLSSSWPAT